MAKKSTAVATRSDLALAPLTPGGWDEELSQYTQDAVASAVGGGWQFISTKGGEFSYNGQDLGDTISVVILGARVENNYFTKAFNPSVVESPECFAIQQAGQRPEDMTPHETAPDKQEAKCALCWANKFGSAKTGKSKACRNYIRLAVLPIANVILDDKGRMLPDAEDRIRKAECARLRCPPTSVGKIWGNYVNAVTKGLRRNLFELVTDLKCEEAKGGTGHTVHFDPRGGLPASLKEAIMARVEEAQEHLNAVPQVQAGEEKKGSAPARRKVVKKKA